MAKKLSDLKSKQLDTTEEGDGEERGEREGWLRWALGWIVVPGIVVGGIIGFGAHVGANYPDAWFPRLVTWLFG